MSDKQLAAYVCSLRSTLGDDVVIDLLQTIIANPNQPDYIMGIILSLM